ncbi:unnamed protein product [Closterium sp. NIES-54]
MYAMSASAEGDCYRCVPPDPGIAAAALGASESLLPGTAPAEALHTFTLGSGASRCFFHDSTTLTPLPALVPVRLADPSGGPVIARSSTVLPCPAVPSGSLLGLDLPSFSTNLVSTAALQDAMVTTTTLEGLCLPSRPRLPRPAFLASRGCSVPLLTPRFPLTTAPLQTHHMDVRGPARVSGQGRERYFLLVVDDYTRYTMVFPLCSKGQVVDVLIPWIRTVPLQLRERFSKDLPVLCLHSDRGGEFSSDLLRDFCCGEGILQSFTLPDSPQQNGIAERRIGLVMKIARTSMIHAAAPHFLWPFAVRYAAHQLNLWPHVSLPETLPTLHWTGKVGDASVFWVRGSRAFVRNTSADKLSAQAIPCVFLGFVPDAPGWQFYHPTLRRVLPSQDVTFDELVPLYHLFPYRSAPLPPLPLFLAPGPPPVDPLPPLGTAPSGVSQVDPPPGVVPDEVAVDSGASRGTVSGGAELGGAETGGAVPGGAETGGAEPGDAEPGGAEPGGAEPEGVEPRGAESEGAESRGAEPQGAASSGGSACALSRMSLQQLRDWLVWRAHLRSGATGAGDAGVVGAGGAGVTAGAGVPGGTAATGPEGARTQGIGAARTGGVGGAGAGYPMESGAARAGDSGAGGAGAGRAGVGGVGAGGTGGGGGGAVDPSGALRPRLYFVPLLQQVLGVLSSIRLTPPLLCPPPDQSELPLQPASPQPAPSPYTEQSCDLTERREPASRLVSPVRTARRVPHSRPPLVLGTHAMEPRPSSVPLRVPVPAPPESSLPRVPDPESDRAPATSPTVSRLLATAVTDSSFESAAASALVAELLGFAAACHLDYATSLVAESASACPPSVGGECALGTDVLEDKQEDFECLAAAVPRFASMLLAPEGDPDAPDIPTPRSYAKAITDDLVFAIADTEAVTLVKSELQKRHTCTDLGELHSYLGLQITRDGARRTITVTQSHMLHKVLQRFGFQFSLPQPTPLSTSHLLSAPPSDESGAEWSVPRAFELPHRVLRYMCSTSGMGLVLGGRGPVVLIGHADTSWVDDSATQRSSQGYTFSLGSWRSTHSSSVLSSSCEAEIYAGAMAAQELRWLTYLLTDLGEQPRSCPILEASDGGARNDGYDDHGTIHPEATNAARSQPCITISVPTGDSALPLPMPLKPQRLPCFDPSQWGGPTVHAWLFTMNVFFDANYVSKDTTKIRYAVSLLRGPAMDWWRVIVTKPMDNATLPTREGQTGPWALSYFVEVPQYCTWDACCAGLRARFEPIAASIAARQRLRTWRQLGSVQDYTSRFLALCEQVGYMHEGECIDCYIGGLKHKIAQEIQLRGITDFQEILAMAEKLDFFRRPRPGSYGNNSNWGHRSRGTNEHATICDVAANAAAAPFKGRCFACNRPGHRKSECPENAKGKGEAEQQKQTKQQGNTGSQ